MVVLRPGLRRATAGSRETQARTRTRRCSAQVGGMPLLPLELTVSENVAFDNARLWPLLLSPITSAVARPSRDRAQVAQVEPDNLPPTFRVAGISLLIFSIAM